MNIERLGVILTLTAGIGYFLVTGKQPPQLLSELFEQDEKAVIIVGRSPDDVFSNDVNFTVGERLYLHLKTEAYVPHYVEWKFENQLVAKGIRLDTSDIDDIDLEALQRQTIFQGGFRIDAVFLNDKNEYDSVNKVIAFRESKPYKQTEQLTNPVKEGESRYGTTGSISYKDGGEVIGKNNIICTPAQNGAYTCPVPTRAQDE